MATADDAPLRYGWESGKSYMYMITIEADTPHYFETLQGTSNYTVKQANEKGFTLTHSGSLTPLRREKDRDGAVALPSLSLLSAFSNGFGPSQQHELKVDRQGGMIST